MIPYKILILNNILPSFGAAEKTRTSTPVKEQRPQRCASTNSATAARQGGDALAERNTLVKQEFDLSDQIAHALPIVVYLGIYYHAKL